MSGVVDAVKGTVGAITGKSSADAARGAADTSAAAQREALEYLKEREQLPRQFSEGALTQLGGLYGLEGGEGSQQKLIDQARQSPLYGAIMGTMDESEEAILRNQSATGGLRTGASEQMLAQNAQQLQQRALLESYNQQIGGLQGLAGLPSNASSIAQGMAGIGNTLAQGQVAGAQAQQQGIGNMLGLGMNALSLAGFSDIRLKTNIQTAGERFGQEWFTWDWNDEAAKLGLTGSDEGVIADYVEQTRPDLVGEAAGYKTVNYKELANG